MKKTDLKKFQETVDDVLIRHVSILDVVTKLQESGAKVNRSTIKTITSCGCIKLNTTSLDKKVPSDMDYEELKNYKLTHTDGDVCPVCKEKIEQEIGNHLFYLSALCNHFNLDLEDILDKEYNRISTLGKFSLY
ncbi:nucleoside triphosphate pyrophosphohydrolase family protein [Helicovermis profundi]|uniref:DUF1573 domain-containing protein n=1 Tax=Helicovermis profundi TaxID=3065157 RepID=A0AAU9EUN7_9FIRM|nr:hypothetical protein HLPR_24910 [Clostridia bacterium S502]